MAHPSSAPLNAPAKILLYFAGVLLLGSLLSAPLFWLVQRLAPAAEARGWLRYETPDDGTHPGWETRRWIGTPLSAGVRVLGPIAQSYGWLRLDTDDKAGVDRNVRKGRSIQRTLKKPIAFARDRGWFRPLVAPEDQPERDAKGWCSFLDANFSKVSNRAILLTALLLLWPLLRSLRIRSLADIGLQKNPHRMRDFFAGWLISVAVMALLGFILLQWGVYKMQASPPWNDLVFIFGSGIAVAFLEEWIFRGAILGSFRRYARPGIALLAVSALFSILHFLKSPGHALAAEDVRWFSGFTILPQRFQQFDQPFLVLGGFTTLFLFGLIAGWAAIHTRSLALGIGFHAGMVFGKFGFNRITKRAGDMRDILPWIGPDDITVGLVGIGVLLLVGWLIWSYARFLRPKVE